MPLRFTFVVDQRDLKVEISVMSSGKDGLQEAIDGLGILELKKLVNLCLMALWERGFKVRTIRSQKIIMDRKEVQSDV